MKKLAFYGLVLLTLGACQKSGYKEMADGIELRLESMTPEGAKLIKVQLITDKIVHVTASAENSFDADTSLMIENKKRPSVAWSLKKLSDTLVLCTKSLQVRIAVKTGEINFADTLGNTILNEVKGGSKTFVATNVENQPFYKIHQVFESPADEAFYGLGQHQNGVMNFKGQDVELFQFNTQVAVPIVVSNKNYGLLWDNYSLTKFGDIRDYQPISILKLTNAEGKEGGLTALYKSATDTNKIFVKQTESKIDYEFITDLKKFPSLFPMGQGLVSWNGSLESDTSGVHKFRFYSAGYAKVWLDGKLVADRWRQCWNPTSTLFTLNMEKGKKYPIRIEWNPDGGESYIGLRCLKPLPAGEQERLSLYSDVAKKIDYYFIRGANIDEVIAGYRDLTGKAPLMPKWAMGLWQSRERYKTQDEVVSTVEEFRKRQIPFDNIVQDWSYWPEEKWGDHTWDSTRFHDPAGMIKTLHEKLNSRFMISVWPKFYEGIENYKAMEEKGYLYMKNIKDKQRDWIAKGYVSTFYDAYNPGARQLFWNQMNNRLFSLGVDAWWMDASEPDIHSNRNIEDRQALMSPTASGPGAQYFNAFPMMNAKGIYEGQRTTNPNQRVFILTRSAYAGSQKFAAATWSGDIGARWDEMKTQISAGLNFCISGIPYWTTDIGGFAVPKRFENAQGADLEEWREQMTRWFQYGTFCPLFRVHGQFPFREMYNVAPENHPAYQAMLAFDKLRYRLMPYVYSLNGMVHFNDYTPMRALVMNFAADSKALNINDEFMYGNSILVAPVTEFKARSREVYLPAGTGWYDLFTGVYTAGGQSIKADAPISKIPLYIKEGAIIPCGPEIQYASEKTTEPIVIYVYTGKDGEFSLYEDEDINYNYEKGAFSNIKMSYSEQSKSLKIAARSGEFNGMQKDRDFTIVFVGKEKPLGINTVPASAQKLKYSGQEVVVAFK